MNRTLYSVLPVISHDSTTEPLGIQTGHKVVFTKMKRSFTFGMKQANSCRVINQTLFFSVCMESVTQSVTLQKTTFLLCIHRVCNLAEDYFSSLYTQSL